MYAPATNAANALSASATNNTNMRARLLRLRNGMMDNSMVFRDGHEGASMSDKMTVKDLSGDLNVSPKDMLQALRQLGIPAKSASSPVPTEYVDKVRAHFSTPDDIVSRTQMESGVIVRRRRRSEEGDAPEARDNTQHAAGVTASIVEPDTAAPEQAAPAAQAAPSAPVVDVPPAPEAAPAPARRQRQETPTARIISPPVQAPAPAAAVVREAAPTAAPVVTPAPAEDAAQAPATTAAATPAATATAEEAPAAPATPTEEPDPTEKPKATAKATSTPKPTSKPTSTPTTSAATAMAAQTGVERPPLRGLVSIVLFSFSSAIDSPL